ncbi:jg7860, partial [Pararge aegeria aegeria]
DTEWKTLNVPVPQSSNPHEYQVDYSLENDLTDGGKYEVTVKVKNDKSWSAHTNPAIVDFESRPQPIQHASVYRSSAPSANSTPFFLVTALMYLLVRMFQWHATLLDGTLLGSMAHGPSYNSRMPLHGRYETM